MFKYLNNKRDQFEAWVATWLPGLKVKIVSTLGVIGSVAALLQEYVTGLPLGTLVSPTNLVIANIVLFTLAYWFKRLADKDE